MLVWRTIHAVLANSRKVKLFQKFSLSYKSIKKIVAIPKIASRFEIGLNFILQSDKYHTNMIL